MMARTGNSRRIIAAALSVWLVLFYVSIHAIHRHAGAPAHTSNILKTDGGARATTGTIAGICPVCLFLSGHKAESPGIPPGPVPRNESTGFAYGGSVPGMTGERISTAAPRAPPS